MASLAASVKQFGKIEDVEPNCSPVEDVEPNCSRLITTRQACLRQRIYGAWLLFFVSARTNKRHHHHHRHDSCGGEGAKRNTRQSHFVGGIHIPAISCRETDSIIPLKSLEPKRRPAQGADFSLLTAVKATFPHATTWRDLGVMMMMSFICSCRNKN